MTSCHEKLRQYRKWGLETAVICSLEMDALVAEFDGLRGRNDRLPELPPPENGSAYTADEMYRYARIAISWCGG